MDTQFIIILIIAIPITAIIDYFVFCKQFKEVYKTEMKWHYFIIPCSLELGCFITGYLIGKG